MTVTFRGVRYSVTERVGQGGAASLVRVTPRPACFQTKIDIIQLASRQQADLRFLRACGIAGDVAGI